MRCCILKPRRLVFYAFENTMWADSRRNSFPIVPGIRVRLRKSVTQPTRGVSWYELEDLQYVCRSVERAECVFPKIFQRKGWLDGTLDPKTLKLLRNLTVDGVNLCAMLGNFSRIADNHPNIHSGQRQVLREAHGAMLSFQQNISFQNTLENETRRIFDFYDPKILADVSDLATKHAINFDEFIANPLKCIKKHVAVSVETAMWMYLEQFSLARGISETSIDAEWVDSMMLKLLNDGGHMYLSLSDMQDVAKYYNPRRKARRMRNINCCKICENSDMFVVSKIVSKNTRIVHRADDYKTETESALKIRTIMRYASGDDELTELEWNEKMDADQLRVGQRVVESSGHRVTCVAGYPGVGKSFVIVEVCKMWAKYRKEQQIFVLAPTGKASDLLRGKLERELGQDVVNEDGCVRVYTIHRFLNKFTEIDEDALIIVDEMSMVGSQLFHRLIGKCSVCVKLLLLGDPDQLPSIERGDVFGQLLKVLDPIRLTERHRAGGDILGLSDAARFLTRLRAGEAV